MSLVRSGTRNSNAFCDPRSTAPKTHGPSETLPRWYFRLAPNFDSSISTVFPTPPIFMSAFRILVEHTVLISLSARITVGFERLVSLAMLLPDTLRTFALIVYAHPYCARNSCRNATPRHASSARAEETFQPHIG